MTLYRLVTFLAVQHQDQEASGSGQKWRQVAQSCPELPGLILTVRDIRPVSRVWWRGPDSSYPNNIQKQTAIIYSFLHIIKYNN